MLYHIVRLSQYLARAGGGGSSGGGGGGGGFSGGGSYTRHSTSSGADVSIPWYLSLIFIAFFGLIFAIMIYAVVRSNKTFRGRRDFDPKKQKVALDQAATADPQWAQAVDETKAVFIKFQHDWQEFDLKSMQAYLAAPYYEHIRLMLTALRNLNRKNVMSNLQVFSAIPASVIDGPGTDSDRLDVEFTAKASDRLIQLPEEKTLTSSNEVFTETWQFQRTKTGWQLLGIKQATEQPGSLVAGIKSFAESNNLYFSPDWGRLLLPMRGQLFGEASFQRSDVNNHCIGLHDKVLIELYTYAPVGGMSGFTIAQATLPKSYENIVIRRKKSFAGRLKGLNRVSMEWAEFNNRYEVYATDVEQVTTFELLHPAFMETLFDLPFEVNIEAIDNVVYLYTAEPSIDYAKMLEILNNAFKELKL